MPLTNRLMVLGTIFIALASAGLSLEAIAAPPPINISAMNDDNYASSKGFWGFTDGINRSSALLGDMWGLRTDLSKHGISLAILETSEYMGNVNGGVKQSAAYDGLTQIVAQMDTNRAFGHYGGLANVSVLNLHGNNLSAQNLYTLQTASGIVGDQATRLWEIWYDQKFLDEDRLSVRVGQQSLDQEFMVSTNALYFINTMFGWPMLPSANMPSGGPAYPLSALGVRFNVRPVDGFNLLVGAFNGDPVKNNNESDPQLQNRYGTSFPTNGGQLYIAEAQFSYPTLGSMVEPGQTKSLGYTYKIGAWYNTNNFSNMAVDTNGLSLADPNSNGNPLQHQGNYAWYAVADQLIWRDDKDPNRTVGIFGRVMGTPLKAYNLIDFSTNIGAVMHSPFKNRPADTLGLGVGYAHVSNQVAQLDQNTANFTNTFTPIRNSETFVELTYQYQWKPWIQIQPDIQYAMNPGGGLANPNIPNSKIKNELILGIRTNISF
ncbi:carbohydrate porin [Polynucleobacter sp. AP-Nickl1-40-C4]|uniref:carbohydrate porin n=1 Tax=Polynucleobacter sp. AP-Nickl1-40-C4 TaxID=3108275 RepID=UPI002B238A7C|nr:carbohydrate porin [Polynucleobacter sp. AP-Nickl1-40-C4]MEA9567125.1 carbohydrate porin [Polynucleobacter sp. AP-Nickl1-40-C4]